MQTASLAEWLSSPETKALVTYLRFRRAPGLGAFLLGQSITPEVQARAAGADEIIRLLDQPPEKIIEIFNNANRELNEQHRRP